MRKRRRKTPENELQAHLRSSVIEQNRSLEGKQTRSGSPRPGLHSRGITREDTSREGVPIDKR